MAIDKSKEAVWRAMQQHNRGKGGNGGDSTGDGGNDQPGGTIGVKDYVDAKNEAMEGRLVARLDQLANKSTIWGAVATGTAIILAVLAFAGDRFDAGLNVSEQRLQQLERDQKQDAAVRSINEKLDKLFINDQSSATKRVE